MIQFSETGYAAGARSPSGGYGWAKSLAKRSRTSLREADASHLPLWHGIVRKVEVLGNPAQAAWTRDGEALHVDLGDYQSDMPVVVKIITD